jgi:hypothetical protein
MTFTWFFNFDYQDLHFNKYEVSPCKNPQKCKLVEKVLKIYSWIWCWKKKLLKYLDWKKHLCEKNNISYIYFGSYYCDYTLIYFGVALVVVDDIIYNHV